MGKAAFDEFYAKIFGERWTSLYKSLAEPLVKARLRNPLIEGRDYFLDPASLEVARQLEVPEGGQWLDLCSAPGGKALAVIFSRRGECTSVLNEISKARRARLKAVLFDHLPSEVMARVRITGHDGTRWGLYEKNAYDCVLVDAPCSGERHLLESPTELKLWKPSRSRHLSVRQHALLCAALDAVRPGGLVVYSTCSISPLENDGVIEKLGESRVGQWTSEVVQSGLGEETKWGRLILPDRGEAGPMYMARLRKCQTKSE